MASQSGYTSAEIISMQNDAVRRVNEMQRLARERVQPQSHPQPNPQSQPALHPHPQPNPSQSHQAQPPHQPHNPTTPPPLEFEQSIEQLAPEAVETVEIPREVGGLTGFLERLGLDDEKILILLLLFILINEGADNILLLALGYILLG